MIRGHRVSCHNMLESLALNQSCGRESLKTTAMEMGNGSVEIQRESLNCLAHS